MLQPQGERGDTDESFGYFGLGRGRHKEPAIRCQANIHPVCGSVENLTQKQGQGDAERGSEDAALINSATDGTGHVAVLWSHNIH